MTFRSHKSRRITASNGATANSLRAAVALTTCLFAAANTFAAEPAAMLKWKSKASVSAPQRSNVAMFNPPPVADLNVIIDHEVRPTQATDPLKDPFGDKSGPAVPPRVLAPPPPSSIDLPSLPPIPPSGAQAFNSGSYQDERCPKPSDLKPISELTNRISASKGDLPQECTIDDRVEPSTNRDWGCTNFTWKASGLCHKPLYFEEEALERYGHSTGPISQPFVSAAHFFLTFPVLPYKMGIDAPWECKYALGYYRPGSCAPWIIPGVPVTPRAVAAETAAVLGLIYILP